MNKAFRKLRDNKWYDMICKNAKPRKELFNCDVRVLELAYHFGQDELMLNLGCGNGFMSPYLENIVNLDFARTLLNELWLGEKDAKRIQADAYNLPFPNEVFQVIIATEVLEHFDAPMDVIEECLRILKQGGYFIITVPETWTDGEEGHYTTRVTVDILNQWMGSFEDYHWKVFPCEENLHNWQHYVVYGRKKRF